MKLCWSEGSYPLRFVAFKIDTYRKLDGNSWKDFQNKSSWSKHGKAGLGLFSKIWSLHLNTSMQFKGNESWIKAYWLHLDYNNLLYVKDIICISNVTVHHKPTLKSTSVYWRKNHLLKTKDFFNRWWNLSLFPPMNSDNKLFMAILNLLSTPENL